MRQPARLAGIAGLLLVIALAVYSSGLSGPLFFDDIPALSANESVKITGSTFEEWRVAAFSSHAGPLRRPIAMLSFAANHAVTGDFSSPGLKAVNLAIHLIIAFLLYFFSRSVLEALDIGRNDSERGLIAITAAALWLLHPLHVSTVLYSVQRMAQLATLFVVAGLWVFMRNRSRWAERGASVGELLATAMWLLLLTIFAALSKENGALLPWLVIVLEVCIFRGVWAGRSNRYLCSIGWMLLIAPVGLVFLVLALSPEVLIGGYAGREFSLEERLLTQLRLLWRYLGWIWLPNIADMGFQHDDIPLSAGLLTPATTLVALVAWPLSLVVAVVCRHRYPLLLLGLLFFLVGHSMESSVLPLEMVYEHRNYLPSIGVCLVMAALLVIPVMRSKAIGVVYPVAGVLMIFSVLLFIRGQVWADELTLSRTNLQHHPESSRSNYFYANAMLRRYRQRESLALSEQDSGELLLLSRHYFERMYQENNRDVAALVMLYYLDSQYFPALVDQINWLSKLEFLLETKTLQASDWNALNTLIDCISAGTCMASDAQVIALLDNLSVRYPQSIAVLRYQYLYLSSREAEPDQLLPLLQRAQEISPGTGWIYRYLLFEYARIEGSADVYGYAQRWLFNDHNRESVHVLKSLFSEPGNAPGLSDD